MVCVLKSHLVPFSKNTAFFLCHFLKLMCIYEDVRKYAGYLTKFNCMYGHNSNGEYDVLRTRR